MTRGRFITLEGGEGAGKTTQAVRLAAALETRGLSVLRTREPGGAPGAEVLRGILLDGGIDWSPRAETLLHFAARAEHVARTVQPALEAGTWVVCDRFYDSTMAYQGFGQGADRAFIAAQIGLLGFAPDLTLVLDVPDAVAAERTRRRGLAPDRYERENAGFHARVRDGFRRIAAAEPRRCVLVNAAGDIEIVHAAIMRAVSERL
ncbi:dTMP kinase [Rhodopila sp.]|uniref:dTMP kinase n=1 Tax=Rhodopila sp. TaxID=2480087 RepID=UPI002D01BE0A|nr:dTMP kinase [Rhodopila sp.]HVZ07138.1 dTMP kinase [Rhodopila sp.]